jgi:hypothetical protein
MTTHRTALILLAVLVVAGGALRAGQAVDPALEHRSADEIGYRRLALNLATEHHVGDVSLHWPPGAPALFALGYWLRPDPELRGAYWMQVGVGTLLIAVVFVLARALAGEVAGVVAAALVAFYPPYIQTTGELLSEPLGALLLTSATLALVLGWRRPSWWVFAVAGFLYALAILTRADFILMPAVAVAVMTFAALAHHDPGLIVRTAGVFAAATALTLAPWLVYASKRAGQFVPVTVGDGSALFVGTYLPGNGTTGGMKAVLGDAARARFQEARHAPDTQLARWVIKLVALRHPDLSRDDALRLEARRNIRRYALGHPVRYVRMMLDKVRRTWLLSSRAGRADVSHTVRIGHAILIVVCFVAGVAAFARRPTVAMALPLTTVLYSAGLHAVFVAKPRYNLPPLPLLVAAGCAGVVLLWRSTRSRRSTYWPR